MQSLPNELPRIFDHETELKLVLRRLRVSCVCPRSQEKPTLCRVEATYVVCVAGSIAAITLPAQEVCRPAGKQTAANITLPHAAVEDGRRFTTKPLATGNRLEKNHKITVRTIHIGHKWLNTQYWLSITTFKIVIINTQ